MYTLGDLPRIDHRLALALFLLLLITYSRLQSRSEGSKNGVVDGVIEALDATTVDAKALDATALNAKALDAEVDQGLDAEMVAAAREANSFLQYLKSIDSGKLLSQSHLHPHYREPEFWLAHRGGENNVAQE